MPRTTPLLVVSDLHITRDQSRSVVDLIALIRQHRGHELIVNGDGFSLSSEPGGSASSESFRDVVSAHPELLAALREHLSAGHACTLIAGNHDVALMRPEIKQYLTGLLGVQAGAELNVCPWFARRGAVHVEHGHRFDPDNAPSHPLIPWSERTEPLGVALTRRFIVPNNAAVFAHAHETTFAAGLRRAVASFGERAPLVIGQYFVTAAQLCWEAGSRSNQELDSTAGQQALEQFWDEISSEFSLSLAALHGLALGSPRPTHHRFSSTFMRLYFDRIFAGATFSVGSLLGLALTAMSPLRPLGLMAAGVSGAYLALSILREPNRYRGAPERRLREAAAFVAETTRAELVIFGHTHTVEVGARYINPGSFAYAPSEGRPYVVVEADGKAELRWYRT